MKIKLNPVKTSIKGKYSLNVYKSSGEEVLEKRIPLVNNVVTYSGAYKYLIQEDPFTFAYGVVGTGTTEIGRGNYALGTQIAQSSVIAYGSRDNEIDNGDGTSTFTTTREITFGVGDVVGTISEVGILNGNLIAGQLIKDEFGNPTTLTILSDEQLILTYILETTVPNAELSVAPIIGSGSVTSPRGTHTYNIYSQPYFTDASIGVTGESTRFELLKNSYILADSNGDGLSFTNSSGGTGTINNLDGTADRNYGEGVFAPSDGVINDIKYICGGQDNFSSAYFKIDPITKFTKNSYSTQISCQFVIEFEPALSKTDSESLSIQVEQNFLI